MLHIEETGAGRRFAAYDVADPVERAERAEAAEHRERHMRLEAEATAADLATLLALEVTARKRAERAADDLAALLTRERERASDTEPHAIS